MVLTANSSNELISERTSATAPRVTILIYTGKDSGPTDPV